MLLPTGGDDDEDDLEDMEVERLNSDNFGLRQKRVCSYVEQLIV